ncbi:MAG: hypothetical protein ACJ73S_03840 [Mycobacteriales bacterium]
MGPDSQWAVLDESRVPIPGRSEKILDYAKWYTDTATKLADHNRFFREWEKGDTEWQGDAAKAYKALMDKTKLADQLDKVEKRFGAVGKALNDYAPKLEAAQTKALQALAKATAAAQAKTDAETKYPGQAHGEMKPAGTPDTPQDVADRKAYHDAVQGAGTDLTTAKKLLGDAKDDHRHAENACAGSIDDASGDGLQNPGWFGAFLDSLGIGDIVHHGLKLLSKIANLVAMAAGILALLTCWIPVVGELFAGIALAASIVTLVADCLLKLGWNEKSWGDLAIDALGVIPFGKLARGFTLASKFANIAEKADKSFSLMKENKLLGAVFKLKGGTWTGSVSRQLARDLRDGPWGTFAAKGGNFLNDFGKNAKSFLHPFADFNASRAKLKDAGRTFRGEQFYKDYGSLSSIGDDVAKALKGGGKIWAVPGIGVDALQTFGTAYLGGAFADVGITTHHCKDS